MPYLTKTRFVTATECPRQAQYATDGRYSDARAGDEFLEALADGGHQVGALARLMYPIGHLVDDVDRREQVLHTGELLAQDNAVVFEGAVQHGNLLVRCDILEKSGDEIKLIEVKSRGFFHGTDNFLTKAGDIATSWIPYLYDVAYQAYVLQLAYPQLRVTPYFMLLDKSATVAVPGLNTKLPVRAEGDRVIVTADPKFNATELPSSLLRTINVSAETEILRRLPIEVEGQKRSFEEFVALVSTALESGSSLPLNFGAICKSCPYYLDPADFRNDSRSGWHECMQEHYGRSVNVPRRDTVFGLYRCTDSILRKLANEPPELSRTNPVVLSGSGEPEEQITSSRRRELQCREYQGNTGPIVLERILKSAMATWRWPLHFIDFETSRPALPYHVSRSPYDQILFQFSHHVLQENGHLEHRTQFLEATPGVAPSIPVLRQLKTALAGDDGTVIHWWDHERTVLGEIRQQIQKDHPHDYDDLLRFLELLIGSPSDKKGSGDRAHDGRLIDLGRLVSRTVFYPGTSGSSSIKRVLQAALRFSEPLRRRYSQAIYGTSEMPSLNFKQKAWVQLNGNRVSNPYDLLEPLFHEAALQRSVSDVDEEEDSASKAKTYVANGGAAMIAYDMLQQSTLSAETRSRLVRELYRYCELDTLAMVMVYQSLSGKLS